MGGGYSANFKVCATCAYWGGIRKLNGTRTQALYEYGTKGDCFAGTTVNPRWRDRPANASCNDYYEKWAQLKSNTSSNKSNRSGSGNKKGVIPYPVAVGLIFLVALIQFALENLAYVISVGIIVVSCAITCLIIKKKAEYPKKKIIITILVGVILLIGTITIISNYKDNKTSIQLSQELLENTTIFEGYKPFLGSFNKLDHNKYYWGKMVIFGKLKTYWGGILIEADRITEKEKYKVNLSVHETEYSKSLLNATNGENCIFFLSFDENFKGEYQIDNFKLYSDLDGVSKPKKYNAKVIDKWIINNTDK